MTMTLSGDGSITGLVAGGLPDVTVQTGDIVDGAVTAAKLSGAQTGAAPVYGCRAWCVFDGTLTGTNAPTAGGNVTSITRNGVGDYTVTLLTAMPDTNYAIFSSCSGDGSFQGLVIQTQNTTTAISAPTTTTFRIAAILPGVGAKDPKYINIAIFR